MPFHCSNIRPLQTAFLKPRDYYEPTYPCTGQLVQTNGACQAATLEKNYKKTSTELLSLQTLASVLLAPY